MAPQIRSADADRARSRWQPLLHLVKGQSTSSTDGEGWLRGWRWAVREAISVKCLSVCLARSRYSVSERDYSR